MELEEVKDAKAEILSLLQQTGMTVFQILGRMDKDIGTVARALHSLKEQDGIDCCNGIITLKGDSQGFFEESLIRQATTSPYRSAPNPSSKAASNDPSRKAASGGKRLLRNFIFQQFRALVSDRPLPLAEYDQGYVTPESVKIRVDLLDRKGDLDGANVLLLGDDDLTSIYLFLTKKPRRITVLDIDERILNFINKVKNRLVSDAHTYVGNAGAWPILETARYDVRENLPDPLKGQYTCVITDPLETRNGLSLFLRRSAEGLKSSGTTLLMCMTDLESPKDNWQYFLKLIRRAGFRVTQFEKNCQRYCLPNNSFIFDEYPLLAEFQCHEEPLENWYHSNLLRLRAFTKPNPNAISVSRWKEIY